MTNRSKRYRFKIPLLMVLAIAIHFFSENKFWVEKYYSTRIYPGISFLLKAGVGWLGISVGDLVYGAVGCWCLYKIFKFLIKCFKERFSGRWIPGFTGRILSGILLLYIAFNLLWGLNYNRTGIAKQLGIHLAQYNKEDLLLIDSLLLERLNDSKAQTIKAGIHFTSNQSIFNAATASYQQLAMTYPFCQYQPASVKSSLWGWLGNYLGFTGYYNPFTGEAQVNTTVPRFLLPFTTCHEIAHQLGYAKENEANFVGYLAAVSSKDMAFHYSTYLDLFLYAQRNLYNIDSAASKSNFKKMLPEVKADLKTWRAFNERYVNPVEPIFTWIYGKYLKNNQQPSGVLSYDEVTGFLVAYYKKYGKI